MLSVGSKQARKDTFLVEFQPRTGSKESVLYEMGNVYVYRLFDRSCGVTVFCRVVDYFEIALRFLFFLLDDFYLTTFSIKRIDLFIYFFFLNSFSTLWENVLSWKISEGTILRYIIQVARFGEEEKYNGYLIREMKLILCSRDGICEKLYSLPTSGHDDIGRVGKWWARDWYDIKGYWSFSEYCRSNVLESCNDSMNSLHYDIPSSMLPRIIERWVNVVIYIYTYN